MSYDKKYRRRAIDYWNDNHSLRETAKVFSISTRTLQDWKIQLKATGELEPKKRKESWRKIDPDRLTKYLKEYPDAYLKEMAEEFNCSEAAIFKALKRLKISRKKNHSFPGS